MDLIIVGAGGLGREIYSWLFQEIKHKQGFKIKGFIDDDLNKLDNLDYPTIIIGTIKECKPKSDERFILSIIEPKVKEKITSSLINRGAQFYTLIHPGVNLGTNIKIGEGCVICPNCILTNDIQLGKFVFINTNTTIGHDVSIGDFTSINGCVDITGNVQVGAGCLFGVGAKIIPGRKIGNNVVVGAGSVVIRNIGSNLTIFGNPAKRVYIK